MTDRAARGKEQVKSKQKKTHWDQWGEEINNVQKGEIDRVCRNDRPGAG